MKFDLKYFEAKNFLHKTDWNAQLSDILEEALTYFKVKIGKHYFCHFKMFLFKISK